MSKMIDGKPVNITNVTIMRNEAENLVSYFNHVRRFADELIVVDQQSTDNSLQLALEFADKVYLSKNVGYKELDRKWARQQAKNEWVSELDPDEEFSEEFIQALPNMIAKCEKKGSDGILCKNVGYWSGIKVDKDEHKKCRIAKKTAPDFPRVHSSVTPLMGLVVEYPLYHLKSLKTAVKEEEHRATYYKHVLVKNKVVKKIKKIIDEGKENIQLWDKIRLDLFKKLEEQPDHKIEVKLK